MTNLGTAVTIRPIANDDLDEAERLCRDALVVDDFADRLPRALLRSPRYGYVAVHGADVVGACFASLNATRSERGVGYLDLIAVSPPYQGNGIGRRLLAVAEQKLETLGCRKIRITGNPPHYAWPGVDVRYVSAMFLFEAAGYRRAGCELTLGVRLPVSHTAASAAEREISKIGITLRRACQRDTSWLRSSLETTWQATWLAEVDAALRHEHAGLNIAIRDGQCVGFCAYGINRPHEVGPIGTHPELRRMGIGSALFHRCLADQEHAGLACAEMPWVASIAWLSQTILVRTSRAFLTYHKDLRS